MTIKLAAKALATCTAAATAMALAAPIASAASTDAPDVFSGSAEALALELDIKTPDALAEGLSGVLQALGQAGDDLNLKVSFTESVLSSDGLSNASARLLDGLIDTGAFGGAEGSDTQSIAAQDMGVVSFGVGTTEYLADAASNHVRSFSELASVRVTAAPVLSGAASVASAAPAELQEVIETVEESVDTVIETVEGLVGELNGVLDEVETIIEENLGQVIDIPVVLPDELLAVPNIAETDLVNIQKIWSTTEILTAGDKVRSVATSGITEASLLGGLVEVPAFQYTSWAEAGGTPGSADAGFDITTIAVRLGETEVRLSDNLLAVGDVLVDLTGVEDFEQLNEVSDILTSIINSAGLSVAPGVGTTEIAEDGTSASAATSAFAIRLTPLHAAGQSDLLDISLNLLPTAVAASAAEAPAPAPEPAPEPALPRTGGGLAILGLAALGGASALRKR